MYKLKDIVSIFIRYLPEGLIWDKKYDSKIYKKPDGSTYGFFIHHFWYIFSTLIRDLLVRMDKQFADSSLNSLGNTLNLPDKCIPIGETYEQRMIHIQIKQFLNKGCFSRADFIYIGNLLGFDDMDILNASEYNKFPPYAIPFYPLPNSQGVRDNLIFVRSNKIFDGMGSIPSLDVPFIPRQKTLNFKILECILNTYKPAYTKIIFIRKQNYGN